MPACVLVCACLRACGRAVKGTWRNDGKWLDNKWKMWKMDGKLREDVWKMEQVRKCMCVYVVVVAAACLAVLAGAVRLSLAMLPQPVVRQKRESGHRT